ncbi:MAG: peptide permease [Myxococcales bacterium]|nr:peptide permease [Myxococcales bacterium]
MTAALSRLSEWIDESIAYSAGPSGFVVLILAGLIASLLPCVYPLYPITAAVIRNRGRGLAHPSTYYVGLVAAYGLLGIAAGTLGGALQQVLRYALTQLVIGSVLLILAAATAGFVHLSVFGAQPRATRSGLMGTALMGLGAGFVSSACVGPVVASILVELASSTRELSVLAVLRASLQMVAFGSGVGLPFLLIGLVGLKLPRAGAWMVWVQRGLAALLALFAYGYFEKALEIWGFGEGERALVLGGSIGLFACIFLFDGPERPVASRLRRSAAAVGAVAMSAVLFRSLGPSASEAFVTKGDAEVAISKVSFQDAGLTWYVDEEAAYKAAEQEGKNVFIDFYGSWCTNCKAFKEMTRTDEALRESLKNAVLLEIRDRSPAFGRYRDDPRFPELKVGLPFFLIMTPGRDLLYKTTDYLRTDEMALFLEE